MAPPGPTAFFIAKMSKFKHIGGQAVIEGVMMKSKRGWSVAVRDPEGLIRVRLEPLSEPARPFKLPVLRGVAALFHALYIGMKALGYSASIAQPPDGTDGAKAEARPLSNAAVGLTMAASLLLGVGLFILLPLYATKLLGLMFSSVASSSFMFNFVDGILRVGVFVLYVVAIGLWGEMRRVFQYHGAEHKVIHAYEEGRGLRAEEVMGLSPLHPRCGTSFLLIVMVTSIFVFSFIPQSWPFLYKFLSRVVFLPLIAGLSYELQRLSAGLKGVLRFLVMPGLFLQRLTTREPDAAQVEVALRALEEVLSLEGGGGDAEA